MKNIFRHHTSAILTAFVSVMLSMYGSYQTTVKTSEVRDVDHDKALVVTMYRLDAMQQEIVILRSMLKEVRDADIQSSKEQDAQLAISNEKQDNKTIKFQEYVVRQFERLNDKVDKLAENHKGR